MTATNQVAKTLGEQMADFLRRKPKNFDVTFSVGPHKIKVRAVKFILKAASPVFEREFDENWKNRVVTDDNVIPLLNIDPVSFRLFITLLILDAWSLDSLKSLNLSPNNLLNLLGLSRRYEITKAIQNLEEAFHDFIQTFDEYKDTDEFLELSEENLEKIFSFENIPLDESKIFECVARWADNRCKIEYLEPTGENYRKVLGASLFQVRFPTLSGNEFTKVVLLKKNFLRANEKLAVYEYIGLDIDGKINWDKSQLPFKTNRRAGVKLNRTNRPKGPPQISTNPVKVNTSSSSGCSVLSLPQQCSPAFGCDGSPRKKALQVNQNISLHGFGFLRPIDGDGNFEVIVQIRRWIMGSHTFNSGEFKKNVFAPKGKIFYFLLDEPFILESNKFDPFWVNRFDITVSLEGPNNTLYNKLYVPDGESFEVSGVQFHVLTYINDGNPLVEFLFKKI